VTAAVVLGTLPDAPLIWLVFVLVPLVLGLFLAWCGREGANGDTNMLCTSCVLTTLCSLCQLLSVALTLIAFAGSQGAQRGPLGKFADMGTAGNAVSLLFGIVLSVVCIKSSCAANELRKSLVATTVQPATPAPTLQVVKPQPEA
jgi:hypothetical protein